MTSLYTEKSVIGRLLTIFSSLFPSATRPTRHLLAWLLIAQLALEVPIGYVMSNGEASKLTLAYQLLDEVMPVLEKRQVILLFDSWYAKRELLAHALRYPNLNVICNARRDTAIFELPDPTAGRRSRPPKYGKRLMLDEIPVDLKHYPFKIDGYLVTYRLVKTRIFGDRTVHAYVTLSKSGSRRLFFSTVAPMALHMSIA